MNDAEFKKWQDKIFQEMKDMEDTQIQAGAGERSVIDRFLEVHGLKDADFLAVYKEGMNGKELAEALLARKNSN